MTLKVPSPFLVVVGSKQVESVIAVIGLSTGLGFALCRACNNQLVGCPADGDEAMCKSFYNVFM